MRFFPRLLFIAVPALLIAACTPLQKGPVLSMTGEPSVRVAVSKGKDSVEISGYDLELITGTAAVGLGEEKLLIVIDPKGFRWGNKRYLSHRMMLQGRELSVDGIPYAGEIILIRENDAITVINRIGMEAYLAGVINSEVSSAWSMEAVKAQAVAARSYAFHRLNSRLDKPYFVESTVMDQAYGGKGSEDERAIRAVNETRGEMLFFENGIALTLFHSNCGGHTEDAEKVWGADYSYLRGVDDRFCTNAPNHFWNYASTYDNVLSALLKAGYLPGSEGEIRVLERSKNGRVRAVRIGDLTLSGEELRRAVGYGRIKSTLFDVKTEGKKITFSGSGSGHGVGMCQWGAKGMAESGYSYKEILHKYYDGVFLKKVY